MKRSRDVSMMTILAVILMAGCSQETAVDNPAGSGVSAPISAAGKIRPGVTGGWKFECVDGDSNEVIVTHGFTLRCDNRPGKLELNWEGNRFFLEDLVITLCEAGDDGDGFEEEIEIVGDGRYNGESGFAVCADFVDSGEPGAGVDEVGIVIVDGSCTDEQNATGDIILQCTEQFLISGNHEAHGIPAF